MEREQESKFYALLHAILAANPEGIAEHELLAALKREGVPLFAENDRHDPLEIFQHHFLLFHLLYGLRDRLRSQRRGDIAIHCLKIVLLPPPAATDGIVPEVFEPLRAYYLDLGQLRGVARSDVEAMLERFWALYAGHERRDRALAVFGLQADAGREEVKRRYRQLAREHHPDRGGDPERFRRVREAAEDLLGR